MAEAPYYSRRSVLKHLGLLMASTAGQEFLAAWLPSTNVLAPGSSDMHGMHRGAEAIASPYAAQFFKPQEFRTVDILTEMILPRDDKPGARDARVADYIDFLVFSAAEFEPAMQKDWLEGLALLDRLSQQEFGHAFAEISDEQRHGLLTVMSVPETDPKTHHEGYPFFRLVKDTTVDAFYTSRVGLMDVLEYQGLSYLSEFPGCTHPEHQH